MERSQKFVDTTKGFYRQDNQSLSAERKQDVQALSVERNPEQKPVTIRPILRSTTMATQDSENLYFSQSFAGNPQVSNFFPPKSPKIPDLPYSSSTPYLRSSSTSVKFSSSLKSPPNSRKTVDLSILCDCIFDDYLIEICSDVVQITLAESFYKDSDLKTQEEKIDEYKSLNLQFTDEIKAVSTNIQNKEKFTYYREESEEYEKKIRERPNDYNLVKNPAEKLWTEKISETLIKSPENQKDSEETPKNSEKTIKTSETLKTPEEKIAEYKILNLELTEEIKTLSLILENKEKTVAEYREEYEEYEKKIREVSNEYIYKLVPENNDKESELKYKHDEYNIQVINLTSIKFKINSQKAQAHKLNLTINEKKDELDRIIAEINELDGVNSKIAKEIQDLNQENERNKAEYLALLTEFQKNKKLEIEIDNETDDIIQEIGKIDRDIKKNKIVFEKKKLEYVENKKNFQVFTKKQDFNEKNKEKTENYRKTLDFHNTVIENIDYQQKLWKNSSVASNFQDNSRILSQSTVTELRKPDLQELLQQKKQKKAEFLQTQKNFIDNERNHSRNIEKQRKQRQSQIVDLLKSTILGILIAILLYLLIF